ncbi:MAG TPA: GNAT family N-acetyltransferase [Methanomassiliicoccales archaeon]|nr:GNAT family N-acetyltransferase [Methanomassiliicoccales archaeon]
MARLEHAAFDGTQGTLSRCCSFLTESERSYGFLRNWSVARLEDWRYGNNFRFETTDPSFFSRNLHYWRREGEVVGLSVSGADNVVTPMVLPDDWETEGEILTWTEKVWSKDKQTTRIAAYDDDFARVQELETRGFERRESRGFVRKYDTSTAPQESKSPEGFVLTTLAEHGNIIDYVDAVRSAFGRDTLDIKWFKSKERAPGYAREWVICALVGDRVASFCEVRVDQRGGYAELDPIGTRPEHQRKGLARALIAESFRRLSAARIGRAYIGSASEPDPSNHLYDSLEPAEKREEFAWEKTLA